MKGKLSDRQQFILEFIREFMYEHQFPPTVRDIQAGCDISSTSVVDYNLQILQREGHLKRLPEVSRGIELLDGFKSSRRDIVSVPIVGNIAAGEPLHIPAAGSREADEFENIDLPSFLTRGKANVYGLRVKGTSMIDAFITDGDLVLLEPISQPQSGDPAIGTVGARSYPAKGSSIPVGRPTSDPPASDEFAPAGLLRGRRPRSREDKGDRASSEPKSKTVG